MMSVARCGRKAQRVSVVVAAIGLLLGMSSCFLLKAPPPPPPPDPWRTTPKVAMSEDYMRSRTGDIMVFLPRTWFLLRNEDNVSGDVAGVAVNPAYTASFSLKLIRSTDKVKGRLQQEGLGGLARMAFEQRAASSTMDLRLKQVIDTVEYAGKRYGYYEYESGRLQNNPVTMRSAVCVSSEKLLYEISLVPLMVTAANPPSEEELSALFQSLLVTSLF